MLALICAATANAATTTANASASAADAACSAGEADLTWPKGKAHFAVEIADTPTERARGLMDRPAMPGSAGMLFVYERPQPVSFWMKNTLIPLDMLFLDQTGTVQRIAHMAKPGDLTPIPGGRSIQFVLEINGGLAARLGLAEGAVLRHPSVDATLAADPCR